MFVAAIAVSVGSLAGPARAAFVTPDPSLPPLGGEWVSDTISQMLDYGGQVQGMDVHLFGFTNIVSTDVGADEVITCNALLTAVVTSFPGEPMVTFAGPMQVVIFGKAGQTTGTYTAETVSLAAVAVGDPALMLRENPALASMGQVTVTDIGGGLYQIDSFFDVFTELSPNGGANSLPDMNATHRLTLVPEPATLSLLALGALALIRRRRG